MNPAKQGYPGFRPYWLALAPTVVQVRNVLVGCVVGRFVLEEGDAFILPCESLRVDWNWPEGGELVPIGTEACLRHRSNVIRTMRLVAEMDPTAVLAGARA